MGSIVEVIEAPISPNSLGQVKWSGTVFNAMLDIKADRPAPIGTLLSVEKIEGNIFYVS
jgi:hypothetical protein